MGSAPLAYPYTKAVTLKHDYEAIDTFGAHTSSSGFESDCTDCAYLVQFTVLFYNKVFFHRGIKYFMVLNTFMVFLQ